MDEAYGEEEMGEDEQAMEEQDVKPDQSIHEPSQQEEVPDENFDTDIRNASLGLEEKLTL